MNDETANNNENNHEQKNLLRKIYYPDTLYPDKYVFLANRRAQSMDNTETPIVIPNQTTIDNETIESQRQLSAVSVYFFQQISMSSRTEISFRLIYLSTIKTKRMCRLKTVSH